MNGTGRRVSGAPARLPVLGQAGHDGAWRRLRGNRTDAAWRLSVTAVVAAIVAVAGIVFAVLAAQPVPPRAAPAGSTSSAAARANAAPSLTQSGAAAAGVGIPQAGALVPRPAGAAPAASAAPSAASTAPPAHQAAAPLVLTAAERRHCPVKATACVDLARHVTWLQSGGKTTFGPVAMEPGRPSGKHQTPRGTFRVSWKAGPGYMSTTYNQPMPWATFFAPGGIAFHGGSLTLWSHGCIHLTAGNAHYYNSHLPVGAEVVVF